MVALHKFRPVFIRILCVFALVLLSFAHRPVDINAPLMQMTAKSGTADEPVFIRYETLPDGSIVSICVSENSAGADNHHKNHNIMVDCEACRISASFALMSPPANGGPVVSRDHNSSVKRIEVILPRSKIYPPAAPPQAPPALA